MKIEHLPLKQRELFDSIQNVFPLFKLGQLGIFKRGKGISNEDLTGSGHPCITYGQLYTRYNGIIKNIDTYVSQSVKDKSIESIYGDILFPSSGETLEEIGKASVNLVREKISAGGDIIIFRPKKDVNPLYLSYILNSAIYQIQSRRLGQGFSVVHIYSKDLEDVIVPVPSIEEQKKIASILSTWDRAIDLKDKEIKNYEIIKENIAKKMIHSYEDKSANGNGKKIKNYLETKTIKVGIKLIEPVAVGVFGIRKRSEIFDKDLSDDLSNNKVIEKNDLCFGMGTNKIVYDVLLEDAIYCVSPAYKVYKIKGCNPYYLKTYLDTYNSYLSRKYMIISARQGKSIELNGLMNELIYLPSIDIQNKVVNYLSKVDLKIKLLKTQHEYLKLQKKGLMQQLLTGKIRVQS